MIPVHALLVIPAASERSRHGGRRARRQRHAPRARRSGDGVRAADARVPALRAVVACLPGGAARAGLFLLVWACDRSRRASGRDRRPGGRSDPLRGALVVLWRSVGGRALALLAGAAPSAAPRELRQPRSLGRVRLLRTGACGCRRPAGLPVRRCGMSRSPASGPARRPRRRARRPAPRSPRAPTCRVMLCWPLSSRHAPRLRTSHRASPAIQHQSRSASRMRSCAGADSGTGRSCRRRSRRADRGERGQRGSRRTRVRRHHPQPSCAQVASSGCEPAVGASSSLIEFRKYSRSAVEALAPRSAVSGEVELRRRVTSSSRTRLPRAPPPMDRDRTLVVETVETSQRAGDPCRRDALCTISRSARPALCRVAPRPDGQRRSVVS